MVRGRETHYLLSGSADGAIVARKRVGGEGSSREENPLIHWSKDDLIGSGVFGEVYLGMDLNSSELLAVKQVMIGSSNTTTDETLLAFLLAVVFGQCGVV